MTGAINVGSTIITDSISKNYEPQFTALKNFNLNPSQVLKTYWCQHLTILNRPELKYRRHNFKPLKEYKTFVEILLILFPHNESICFRSNFVFLFLFTLIMLTLQIYQK